MDTVWIKTRMRELKIKQKSIAAQMGLSDMGLSHKIRNRNPMTLAEAKILAINLQMTNDEIAEHLLQLEV